MQYWGIITRNAATLSIFMTNSVRGQTDEWPHLDKFVHKSLPDLAPPTALSRAVISQRPEFQHKNSIQFPENIPVDSSKMFIF